MSNRSVKNERDEHRGARRASDKVQDALGGLAGRVSAKTVSDADTFVESAAVSDMFELAASKVALDRSTSPEIQAVALQMLEHHTTTTHQLQAALEMNETRDVAAPPEEMDKRRRKMLEHLCAAPDDKFDATYLDQQVMAHEEALNLMHGYWSKGDNAQLVSVAAGTAPVIERHLSRMKALQSRVGSG